MVAGGYRDEVGDAAVGDSLDGERLLAELLRLLHELSSTFARRTREALDDLDLSESAAGVLWMLDPAAPPATMRQLARRLGCDPSNISLVSARLERAGMVERRVNPDDARSRLLVLTGAGRAVRTRLLNHVRRQMPLADLEAAEQRELVRLLGVVSARAV